MNEDNFISVAIPTFYSSHHIEECLKSFIDIPKVNEIIINDDGSSEEEYKKLNKKVSKIESKLNLNIKVSNNKENKGGFKNKYLTVSKCKNNIIYQIDSDNFLTAEGIRFLKNINLHQKIDKLILPGKVNTVFEEKSFLRKRRSFNKIIVSQNDLVLNYKMIKAYLLDKEDSPIPENTQLGLKWLLNLGNPIFNKNFYLDKLQEGFNSENLPLEACSIAMTYFWIKNGGEIQIFNEMTHNQRIHKDSYYIREGDKAKYSVNYFYKKILELT